MPGPVSLKDPVKAAAVEKNKKWAPQAHTKLYVLSRSLFSNMGIPKETWEQRRPASLPACPTGHL